MARQIPEKPIRLPAFERIAIVPYYRKLNLYRITVRDQEGKISDRETRATSLVLSVQELDDQFELAEIERLHRHTGEVVGAL